jgi:hypothetical protein
MITMTAGMPLHGSGELLSVHQEITIACDRDNGAPDVSLRDHRRGHAVVH